MFTDAALWLGGMNSWPALNVIRNVMTALSTHVLGNVLQISAGDPVAQIAPSPPLPQFYVTENALTDQWFGASGRKAISL
jgi:hypothetical protein